MTELSSPIGLIAGSGSFPLEFAESAKGRGLRVIALAHTGETDPQIENIVERCIWIKVGQLGKIISTLKSCGVKQVALAGAISRIKIFKGVKLDLKGAALIARLRSVSDDVVLRGVAEEIERCGINVISPSLILDRSLPKAGCLTRRALNATEISDALVGWRAAKGIGVFDIGQTVVVNKGLVVAVESIEGTDATIRRAGTLSGPGAVVIKLSKPQQDLRLDLPTIGLDTISVMQEAGVSALIIEADKTIILDPVNVVDRANKAGIAIEVVALIDTLAGRIRNVGS